MYKLTNPDGTDFYSGTINYAENIGKIIRLKEYDGPEKGPCGRGLHASKKPNDCFVGAKIPCRAFRVKGIDKIAGDKQKSRYKALKVIEEVKDLDKLFGWHYTEACNPIHPFKIKPPEITETHIQWLREWASVWASVRASVGASVWASVWDSVWSSVWDSVWSSVWDSVWASVWASVRASVWDSVEASVWAYIGYLFLNIKRWKYIKHKPGVCPFQSTVNLWKVGLVPSFDGKIWRLHGGPDGKILWEDK